MKLEIKVKEERFFQGGEVWINNGINIISIKDITTKKEAILTLLNFVSKVVVPLLGEGNWDVKINIPANSNSDIFDIIFDSNIYISRIDNNREFCAYKYNFTLKN
jgi:hypothetical protein